MVFHELDRLYEENGVAPEKRLALMEAHQQVINRDEVIAREINLAIFAGKADLALQLIQVAFLPCLGGRREVLARRLLGERPSRARPSAFRRAGDTATLWPTTRRPCRRPSNLQESAGNTARKGEVAYWIGNTHEALGDLDKAHQSWRDAAEASTTSRPPAAAGAGGGGGSLAARPIQRARCYGRYGRRRPRGTGGRLLSSLGPPETR